MAKTPEVHWAEGMFLRPHHLQLAERHREELLRQEVRRLQPFFWGLLKIDIALDQLENFTFEVRDCEVKLKDGTSLSLSSNLRLPPRTFKTELDQAGGRMEVWLGIPSWRELDANAFQPGESVGGQDRRWSVESVEVLDENTGGNAQVLESRAGKRKVLVRWREPRRLRVRSGRARRTRGAGQEHARSLDRVRSSGHRDRRLARVGDPLPVGDEPARGEAPVPGLRSRGRQADHGCGGDDGVAADLEAPDPRLLPLPVSAVDAHPPDPPLHRVRGVLPARRRAFDLRRPEKPAEDSSLRPRS